MSEINSRDFLYKLEEIIHQRLETPGEYSYTAKLAGEGIGRVAQKVGEEAIEVALASVTDASGSELRNEAADLVYHLLLLLAVRGIRLDEIAGILAERHEERVPTTR